MTTSLVRNRRRNPYFSGTPAETVTQERVRARGDWVSLAKCRDGDPDALFVRGAAQRSAAPVIKMWLSLAILLQEVDFSLLALD